MKRSKSSFLVLFIILIIMSVPQALFAGESTASVEPISLINAEKTGDNKVIISWEGLDTKGIYYNIYRSTAVIDKAEELKTDNLIKSLPNNMTVYTDTVNQNGSYYYAVTTTDKDKNENKALITEQNYIITPIDITLKNAEPAVPVKKEVKATNAGTPVSVVEKKPVKQEVKPVIKIVSPPVKPKKVQKATSVKMDTETALENILKKYYFKNNYEKTIKELNKIIGSRTAMDRTKAKAKLFLGRSYLQLNNYDLAIQYLTESREFYKEESDFWIKEALKNIK